MNQFLHKPKHFFTTLKFSFAIGFAALLLPGKLLAQAPTISYAGPNTLNLGAATNLTPASSNVAAPTGAYGSPVVLGTGLTFSQNGVAVDAADNIYTTEEDNNNNEVVIKISPDGSTTTTIASGFLTQSSNVAVDRAGNVFVVDQARVWKIPASGSPVTYGTPVVINNTLSHPFGLAVDNSGNVYVSDINGGVFKMASNGSNLVRIDNGLSAVSGLAVDAKGNVYAASYTSLALIEIPAIGGAAAQVQLANGFSFPRGLAVDAAGTIYVDDEGLGGIYSVPASGGTPVAAVPGLTNLVGVAVDANYNLYGALQGSGGINKFSPTGGYFISPALSAGLSFNATTGVISGRPAAPAAATDYKVGAYNATAGAVATVNIRVVSPNDNLGALKLSAGVLSPVFTVSNTSYTTSVVNAVKSITITPRAADSTAAIAVNGQSVASGHASPSFTLSLGDNVFDVVVTSSNGLNQKTYTVTVTRATSTNANLSALQLSRGSLTPYFAPLINSYTVAVANGVSSIKVTPVTADADAIVTVNGMAAVSGTAFGPVALAVGANVITTAVTASDGLTQKTYTVTITRAPSKNDYLLSLKLNPGVLSPLFTGSNTSYTVNVVNGVSSLTVTPTAADVTATLLLNGTTAIASGAASAPIPIAVGANSITVQVTAQDGSTTQTYAVTVNRALGTLNIPDESLSVAPPLEKAKMEDNVAVRQGLSPNGDGINDYLVIDGIQTYPDNKLTIMNRNGALVFEAKGYDNSNRVFNGRSNKNGQLQLPGTYFYSLEYSVKGETRHKTGFIVLKY